MAKVTKPASKSEATAKAVKPAAKAPAKTTTSTKKETAPQKEAPAKAPKEPAAAKAPAKKAAAPAPKAAAPEKATKAAPEKKAPAAAKAEPKKAAAPAKETAANKAAPAKAAPVAKPAAAKAAAAKEAPKAEAPKAAPAKPAAKKSSKKPKVPVKKVITAAAFAARTQPAPQPSPAPRPTISLEPKKAPIVIAHRPAEQKKEDVSRTMISYTPETTRSLLDRHEDIGPVYRYSDDELGEFRELVQRKLETARKDLAYFQSLLTHRGDAGTEDTDNRYQNMEDGSAAHDREQVANLASRQIQFINNLEKALIRIENKTYGICRVTGKLIDKKRLQAVPHATLSVEAKNMRR